MSPRARQRELDSLQDWQDERDRDEEDMPEQDDTKTRDYRPSTDLAASVSDGFHWMPIDANTPRGCKLQLINEFAGVACYGSLGTADFYWTHWAPLPTFRK